MAQQPAVFYRKQVRHLSCCGQCAWQGDTGSYKLLVEAVTHVEDYETDSVPTETVLLDKTVDDYPADTGSAGTVAVGAPATGGIERAGDRDWFAVELVAGRHYRIDLEGSPTGQGTLADPYLRGIYRADGSLPRDTDNNDGGDWLNSRVYIIPTKSGTYFIAAGADGCAHRHLPVVRAGDYR